MRIFCFSVILWLLITMGCGGGRDSGSAKTSAGTTYFTESFENTRFSSRDWYDGKGGSVTSEGLSGDCLQWSWVKGASGPTGWSTIRKQIVAGGTDRLYVKFYWKFSNTWIGSQQNYHPHLICILSDLDYEANKWGALASNYLNTYIEALSTIGSPYAIMPQIAIQDSLNVNSTDCNPSTTCNLNNLTENRSVAGCNGTLGDAGTGYECSNLGYAYSARRWLQSDSILTKNKWYKVECYFKMNTMSGGKAVADGIMKEWIDGVKVLDKSNVVYRTNQHSTMKWEEFVLSPWIGDGSPIAQTMYMDELTVGDTNPYDTVP
jgi:hypothetical protein